MTTARSRASMGSLMAGHWVALCLRPDAAPLRVYVGQIQALDDRGVRITLVDWIIGGAHGFDFFAPWDSIMSAMVATPDHDVASFGERAGAFQTAMGHTGSAEIEPEPDPDDDKR